ncbi:MAG: permease, partial [Planctomycetota bacterium]
EEAEKAAEMAAMPEEEPERELWQNCLYFFSLAGILVFANWGTPTETSGLWYSIYNSKWLITSAFALLLGIILILWFKIEWWKILICAAAVTAAALIFPGNHLIIFSIGIIVFSYFISIDKEKGSEWFSSSWDFAKQILPLLLFGVLIAGALLGRVGHEGLIPSEWVEKAVGGNSLQANFFASFAGAFMYFATLTEVPILQGLLGNGMGKGPALALLLAGPALSLPNMLVIRSVMGTKKTIVFVMLVIAMATVSGLIFGAIIR